MADRDESEFGVLTDAQWGRLAPLIEAIIWRHDNGAKWRAIPAELGLWWMAAQCFNRWFHLGVWERLLGLAREGVGGANLGMAFLDGTSIRAHAKTAGAAKKGELAPSGTRARRSGARAAATARRR